MEPVLPPQIIPLFRNPWRFADEYVIENGYKGLL